MVRLLLIFENSNKFYFEGEKVKIKLEVHLENAVNVSYIVANFNGFGMYLNSEKSNKVSANELNSKGQTEIYFNYFLPIFAAQSEEQSTFNCGVQVFVFDYQLPNSLPTSIESVNGFIRYSVQVNALIDGKLVKKTEYFTIMSKTDITKNVSAHLPAVLWIPENQCFLHAFLCNSGPVRAFLHINKRGYVPGEYLYINAEVCNFHRFPVEWVKATLVQILKYQNSKSLLEKRTVSEKIRGCILPCETQTWQSESMLIPAVPPTSYSNSKIVQIKYNLYFQYKPSWQRKPIELKNRIIIGVAELVQHGEEQNEQNVGDNKFNSKCYNDYNLEPCIFGPHTIIEDDQSSTFSPLYPIQVV